MAKKRVFRAPLKNEWANALLDGTGLEAAKEHFDAALGEAREVLAEHPLAQAVAEKAARDMGKRGAVELVIDEDGTVILQVHYGRKQVPKAKPAAKSKLPPIDELRAEAEQLGIDVSDLGKAKRKIIARIEAAKAGDAPAPVVAEAPKPKMIKTAPALSAPKVLTLGDDKGAPPKPVDLATVAAAGAMLDVDSLFDDADEG